MATKTLFGYVPSTHCAECGRLLTDPVSVQRGIGPVCWGAGKEDLNMKKDCEYSDGFLDEFADVEECGIVLKRDGERMNPNRPPGHIMVWTNIPHLVTHHSPDGYEWGYGGSGPADLALNILELVLRRMGYKGPQMECWNGKQCFEAAWAMHQDFKRNFVAACPEQGGVLPWATVTGWIETNTPDYLKLDEKFGHAREDDWNYE